MVEEKTKAKNLTWHDIRDIVLTADRLLSGTINGDVNTFLRSDTYYQKVLDEYLKTK